MSAADKHLLYDFEGELTQVEFAPALRVLDRDEAIEAARQDVGDLFRYIDSIAPGVDRTLGGAKLGYDFGDYDEERGTLSGWIHVLPPSAECADFTLPMKFSQLGHGEVSFDGAL